MPATDQGFANGFDGPPTSLRMTPVQGANPYSKGKVVWRLSGAKDEILGSNLAKHETAGGKFRS